MAIGVNQAQIGWTVFSVGSVFRQQSPAIFQEERVRISDGIQRPNLFSLPIAAALESVSPLKKLGRGYGFVAEEDGTPITSVTKKKPNDRIRVILGDGELISEVKEVNPYGRE